LFAGDTLANPVKHDDRSWGIASREIVFELSLEAVYQVGK